MTGAPGYWMHEATGVLAPAVKNYLTGELLTLRDVSLLRAYFRQWITTPAWRGAEGEIDALRDGIDDLLTRADIERWLAAADALGIDPL